MSPPALGVERARTVADAVLYEGYLLYPYRATSQKNQARWQFGVLGPPGAAEAGIGENRRMSVECLLQRPLGLSKGEAVDSSDSSPGVRVYLRFLQLQRRIVEASDAAEPSGFRPVDRLAAGDGLILTWDEAKEQEVAWPGFPLDELAAGMTRPVEIDGGDEIEPLRAADGTPVGRVVRRRWPLTAELRAATVEVDGHLRLSVTVENTTTEFLEATSPQSPDDAIRTSLIGAHLLLQASGAEFVSLLEPPAAAALAVAGCSQHRCWPVLAGAPGSTDVVLASPIILYDYPEVAEESAGALFDSTEIDEILSLRVLTMTDAEKAEARATDPRAAEIVDRCEQLTPEALQQLHGILRDPHGGAVPAPWREATPVAEPTPCEATPVAEPTPWWDPAADASVRPELDAVVIDGVSVRKDSWVRIHPGRRADAQDLFFADRDARVTAVLSDVDGSVHVAVVLLDDPAADLHEWYGRYLYFAPDELEPLPDHVLPGGREENGS